MRSACMYAVFSIAGPWLFCDCSGGQRKQTVRLANESPYYFHYRRLCVLLIGFVIIHVQNVSPYLGTYAYVKQSVATVLLQAHRATYIQMLLLFPTERTIVPLCGQVTLTQRDSQHNTRS
jgi:hypothetical protein